MTTKKTYLLTALLGLFTANAQAGEEVRIYNWSDYIDQNSVAEFEKETGIKVIYDVYDSNDILEAKLLAGNSGYDIVFPSANFMSRQIKAGVFQPLQKDKLTNKKHIWEFIADKVKPFDPDNKYSINYMWGTTALGINEAKIKEVAPDAPLDSWEMLFNPKYAEKIAKCGIYVLDTTDEMVPAALNYQGKDPNSHDMKDLKGFTKALEPVRPYIKKFSNSDFIDGLANGDICLAVGYSGDVIQAAGRADEAKNGVKVKYVIPKEGAKLWFDQMAILADAPNVDNAHKFIDYMLKPEVIAKSSDYVFYANGNKDAREFMDKAVTGDPAIYPDEATMKKLYVNTTYTPRQQKTITRLWTKFKASK
ncbi:MAG: spermidine/putrescine ABC transporter substrate-binding protein PotF [Gammaproteobacteria bacterium]|nr:MAG: spermidine/putrescine ABC transporter substrate-binding protein PotF [Gammaproteobacteria bacterium]